MNGEGTTIHITETKGTEASSNAAHILCDLIQSTWPDVVKDDNQYIEIITDVKCYGHDTKDIDIVALIDLGKPRVIPTKKPEFRNIRLKNVCLVIEVKEHSPDKIKFDGNQLWVLNRGEWKNATIQSFNQLNSLKNYIEQRKIVAPWIVNLIWLRNVTTEILPTHCDNILGSDSTWNDFLDKVLILQRPKMNENGEQLIFSQKASIKSVAKIFTNNILISRIDNNKMKIISKGRLTDQKYSAIMGQQMLIFRGGGGTGKTITLLKIAYDLYSDRDSRVLILTFNRTLVSDIKMQLGMMGLEQSDSGRCISIMNIDQYIRRILDELGFPRYKDNNYDSDYPKYKKQLLDLLDGYKNHGLSAQKWDYVFIDEAQDWPDDERDIMFSLFDYRKFVLADGVNQLTRRNRRTNWREGTIKNNIFNKSSSQVVALSKSLRLKSALCDFVNSFGKKIGSEWGIDRDDKIYGGRVVIVEGKPEQFRPIIEDLIARNEQDKNKPRDMLFCHSKDLKIKTNGTSHSLLGKLFSEWGYKIWDATGNNKERDNYPRDLEQLRIVLYDSCRGLEGWTVVNFGLDSLFDHKCRSYKEDKENQLTLLNTREQEAVINAKHWLMIPLTRAIDTLVIQINSKDSYIGKALWDVHTMHKDVVEWRTL